MAEHVTHKPEKYKSSDHQGQHEAHEMSKNHHGMKHRGRESSQVHEDQHEHGDHENHKDHKGGGHHAHMVSDFRKRFWISLIVTIPILILSPMIQVF